MADSNDEIECAMCLEEITKFAVPFSNNFVKGEKSCKHNFCYFCLKEHLENKLKRGEKPLCPLCNESFDGFIENKMANDLFEKTKLLYSKSIVLQNNNRDLENTLNGKGNEVLQLSKQIKEFNKEFNNKETENQNMKYRIENLERELNENSTIRLKELESYQSKIDIQQQQILKLTQNNNELKDYASKSNELHQKNKFIEASLKEMELTNQDQSNKLRLQDQQLSTYSQKSQKLMHIVQSQQEEIQNLKNQIQESQATYYTHLESADRHSKTIQDMESAISALKVELSNSKTQISQLTQKNRSLEKEIEEFTVLKGGSSSSNGADKNQLVSKITSSSLSALNTGFSYLWGGSNNSSSSPSQSGFTIPWKSLSVFERRNTSKSSIVKRVVYNNYQYVLKSIPYQIPTGLAYYTQYSLSENDLLTFREPMILYKMNHFNIIKLEAMTKDDSNGMIYSILSPLAPMDLEFVIAEYKKSPPTYSKIKYIIYQILSAVNYLHSQEIVHRDLKSTSVLVYQEDQIKLCSFSKSASVFTFSSTLAPPTKNSSPCYLSPEFLFNQIDPEYRNNNQIQSKVVDWKSFDMWAVGCICLELIYGRKLFMDTHPSSMLSPQKKPQTSSIFREYLDVLCNIFNFREISAKKDIIFCGKKFSIPQERSFTKERSLLFDNSPIPDDLCHLLTSLLNFDPDQRIKSSEAILHPIFKNEIYFTQDNTKGLPSNLKYKDIASTLTDRNIKDFLKEKCQGLIQV